MPHQEAIAGIFRRVGVVIDRAAAIDLPQHGDAATVIDVVNQSSRLAMHWTQQHEFAGEVHAPVFIARRPSQIDDAGIGALTRVERKMGYTADFS
jgi:hypothetical protein